MIDGCERAACSERDGCKAGTLIEHVIIDLGDGCGDGDGGDRGPCEHVLCDGCERGTCSERGGCKTGTLIERVFPNGCDGCGNSNGGESGSFERMTSDRGEGCGKDD